MSHNSDMIRMLRLVEGQQFAGLPEQQPGDQVRGTEQAKKNGQQHPFHNRLVGEEISLEDKLSKKYQDMKDLHSKDEKEKDELEKKLAEGSLNEFDPGNGEGDSGNYFRELASAWYTGAYNSGSLQKGIKTNKDIERLLQRGIVAPDGVTRKYNIDYNSDFDGVIIFSDDYYEHGDDDETDSRTGKPFGPYDYMEFSDDELSESLGQGVAEGWFDNKASPNTGTSTDPLQILGFETPKGFYRRPSSDEIKQAYRKLASQNHPDRGGDPATFQKIAAAYKALVSSGAVIRETKGVAEASDTMQRYGQKILKRAKAARDAELELKKEEPPASSDYSSMSTRDYRTMIQPPAALLAAQLRKPKKKDVAENNRPFRGVGGAFNRGDDERHDLDPTDWYIVKDGEMFSASIYPRQVQQAIAQGFSLTRAEAKAKSQANSQTGSSEELEESQQESPMERPMLHRIMMRHMDLIEKYGIDLVLDSVRDVADSMNIGPDDEIGTSDVSAAMVNVMNQLKSMDQQIDEYGSLPGTSAEPVAGTVAPSSGSSTPNSTPANAEPASGGSPNNTTLSSPAAAGVSAGGSASATPSALAGGSAAKPGAPAAPQPNVPDVPITPDEKSALDRIRANAGLKTQFDNLLKQVQPKVQ